MGAIYESAYLTIAAALAHGDEDGFLQPSTARDIYTSKPVELNLQGQRIYGIRTRKPYDFRDQPAIEPLSSRGWTLQERLLSGRLLSFSSGVTFECRQTVWCECGEGPYPDRFGLVSEEIRLVDKADFFKLLEVQSKTPDEIYNYWNTKIVTNYSDRDLTKDSDRLPAVSALASKFKLVLGDEYLAGLWRKNLRLALTWIPANIWPSNRSSASSRKRSSRRPTSQGR